MRGKADSDTATAVELNLQRQIPILSVARVTIGPDVLGCRPVLVVFESFRDKEDVLGSVRFFIVISLNC